MSAKTNRSLFLILIATLLLFFMLGCSPFCLSNLADLSSLINLGGTGSVKGTCYITTNEGKEPVGSLSVTVGDKTVTSNTDGTFLVTGLKPGTYDIRVSGGDLGYTGKVTVTAGATAEMGELQLHGTLPPPPSDTPGDTLPDT